MTEDLSAWIGRRRSASDSATATPVQALAATLGIAAPATAPGAALPPGWHWLYFLPTPPASALAPDGTEGHGTAEQSVEGRGDFLPPVALPRRMWAGGSFTFHRPVQLGERLTRVSTIRDVVAKTGRQGALVFVTLAHDIAGDAGVAVSEEQTIVYRPPAAPGAALPAAPKMADPAWRRHIEPDPILLFRFSALTFNAHRIHYDRAWAIETEGYPGLVVHGPLQALLLLELMRAEYPDRPLRRFTYRAEAPIFDTGPFTVNGMPHGDGAHLWTADAAGRLGMSGRAGW
jgi:3-methylfumaryl-CoA hydratase